MVNAPSPRPCESCPYRRDVPPGIWAESEYRKLPAYDAPTGEQPAALFLCHQNNADDAGAKLCSGWVGCHGQELLALRLAAVTGEIDAATAESVWSYQSPEPLFDTGRQAAEHGLSGVDDPDDEAMRLAGKIASNRGLNG